MTTMAADVLRPAIYARVSSEQQAKGNTIASQIAALRSRVEQDELTLDRELNFIDEGSSGSTLIRPALERLRDQAAAGAVDRLYVLSPDRLARKYAYQVLLVDELRHHGVEVVFLDHGLGRTPEESLLLQVQGMIAEYERAKILERSRRGRRHAAHSGSVNVLAGAPYGYRYIGKHEGGGQARYEVLPEQARVVGRIFAWVGLERCSLSEVCRRLGREGVRTRSGKASWDRTTIWEMLRNPAYKGMAAFGKTRAGEPASQLRPRRGRSGPAVRPKSVSATSPEERIVIPVPAIVDAELFEAVQEQLAENRRRSRLSARGARYLLQGLVVCRRCGYAFSGKPAGPSWPDSIAPCGSVDVFQGDDATAIRP
jgi:site-specific DNA recombinase